MRRNPKTAVFAAIMGSILVGWPLAVVGEQAAAGKEVAPFTIVTKENLGEFSDASFEGHRLGDLIPDRLAWQIREHGLKLQLKPPTPGGLPYDPRIRRYTEQYRGKARVDSSTFMIGGYQAGVPFPDIEPNDPLSGVKVVWNYTYAQPHGDHFFCEFVYNFIDGDRGLERSQQWTIARYFMRGRVTSSSHTVGGGDIFHKTLLFARFPQDIKGLGTFTVRYDAPRLDDIWAYVRTVRRVRRLSGGAWLDPIGGTDFLQDDIETFNAHPSWYKEYKLLGRRQVLAIANSMGHLPAPEDRAAWQPGAKTLEEEFPRTDFTPPYWNPKDVWEVRPVWVVEAVPPPEHPYSRKINYFDAEIWRPYFAETYDKAGNFWKWMTFANREWDSLDGFIDPETGKPPIYMLSAWGVVADFPRRHATIFNLPSNCTLNSPDISVDDVSLTQLEAAGR